MDRYLQAIENWRGQSLESETEYAHALLDFEVLFSYHSGRLDNEQITFSDTREIFLNGAVSDYSGQVSTLVEIRNLKKCCDLVRARLCEGRPLSVELAMDLFERFTLGMDDRAIEQPLPDDKDRLREVLEEVNAYAGDRVLKAGTYLHAAMLYLSPFGRYTGQIARLLLNHYLMSHNHPPLVVYSFDGDIYRECLDRFAEMEELAPLYKFLQYETEKLWARVDTLSGSFA